MIELTIKVSNEEQRLVQKHLLYDDLHLSKDNPVLLEKIKIAVESFKGTVEDVVVKVKMLW